MKNRKVAAILLVTVLSASLLTGCGNTGGNTGTDDTGKVSEQGGASGSKDKKKDTETVWKAMSAKIYYAEKTADSESEEKEIASLSAEYNDQVQMLKSVITSNERELAEQLYYAPRTEEYEYDSENRRTLYRYIDADGKETSRKESSYSEDGLTVTENRYKEGGKLSSVYVTEYYDKDLENEKHRMEYSVGEDGGEKRLTYEKAYDEHGNQTLETTYYNDGGISEYIYEYTYDANGAYTAKDTKRNGKLNGHTDYITVYDEEKEEWVSRPTLSVSYNTDSQTGESGESSRTVYTRDEKGNLLSSVTTDTQSRVTAKTEYEYNAAGKETSKTEYDFSYSSVPEGESWVDDRTKTEYDAEGNRIKRVVEDVLRDGSVYETETTEYDKQGRPVKYTSVKEDATERTEYTYEGDIETYKTYKRYKNDKIVEDNSNSYDANGNVVEAIEQKYTYDENGQLTKQTKERMTLEWKAFEVKEK